MCFYTCRIFGHLLLRPAARGIAGGAESLKAIGVDRKPVDGMDRRAHTPHDFLYKSSSVMAQ